METKFARDARAFLLDELRVFGHAPEKDADNFTLARLYFGALWRMILPAPRTVSVSTTLQRKMSMGIFDREIHSAIDEISRRSQEGESLQSFQTTRVADVHEHDDLLNDWRIHHLHVGIDGSRAVRRAHARSHARGWRFTGGRDDLLFVYATEDSLYLLDVLDHHSFADTSLLQIIHDEWPELIQRYRAAGVLGPQRGTPPISAADRRTARRSLTMLTVMSDGTVYFPPGGGASTARTCVAVVDAADRFLSGVEHIETRVRAAENKLRNRIAEAGHPLTTLDLEFRIREDGRVILVDRFTQTSMATEFVLGSDGSFRTVLAA